MGWVADPTLVAATAKAGGFGFLAGAVMTLDEIEAGILAIKSQTDAPFGVNFHMYVPFAEDIVDLCIEQRVRAVSYSRSPSAKSVEKLKAAGVVCIPTVGAFKHAIKAVELGADALVIQGGGGWRPYGFCGHQYFTGAGSRCCICAHCCRRGGFAMAVG